tara:strand:- start:340 stop:621 length:282 start_codon:yes stop_codon:yes gene_type:complete
MASLPKLMKKHWGISMVLIGCVVLGTVLGAQLLPEKWHLARRILGGGLGGSVCGVFVVAHRLIEGAGQQALANEEDDPKASSPNSSESSKEEA